jgi:hypothetical protein
LRSDCAPRKYRSPKAMMTLTAIQQPRHRPSSSRSRAARLPNAAIRWCIILFALCAGLLPARAQTTTGPQQLTFAGLRSSAGQGQFNALKTDASGNLYLLLDQKDGVRLLKTDPTATNILAQAHLGAAGDIGLALAIDPAGNLYVAGTTTSTTLAGTSGAAFPNRADSSTNSFIARFDENLNPVFVTFAGSGRLAATSVAATSDAVYLTGLLFAPTLPVTPNAIQQAPAPGSSENGFVERFSSDGSTLIYATYLTGANGDTAPSAIAADSSDNAYIAGYTTASGFPTIAALVPLIPPAASGAIPSSGFLTRLTPLGDAITFSTFIPGSGITSLAYDPSVQNLLLSGPISLSQFPVSVVPMPLVSTTYQILARIAPDGSSVLNSTLLAPGTQSAAAPAGGGSAWVSGALTANLLPLTPLSSIGSAFAIHTTPQGAVDQTARFGGRPATNPNYSASPVNLTALAADPAGNLLAAGSFTPTTSSDLLPTETYDLALANSPTSALPSAVTDAAQPALACNGSACGGAAAYLAKLTIGTAAPSLALSTGSSPDILLRNLGSAQATGLQIAATGFTPVTTCTDTLPAGSDCAIALTGPGPGSLTVSADNAVTQSVSLPAVPAGIAPNPLVFSPRELDFGIQTTTSAPILRTLTITNLAGSAQTFTPALDAGTSRIASPFSIASSDCPTSTTAAVKTLPAGTTCHIVFAFALTSSTPDGPTQSNWTIDPSGTHDALLTGYAQTAALSTSTPNIDFGTQFAAGLTSPRYLYLSNNSDTAAAHSPVALQTTSPFTVTDRCPTTLIPHSVCQLQLTYTSSSGSADDSATLNLDQGLTVLVTGQTLPQPSVNGNAVNPSLAVSPTSVTFPDTVPVTGLSATTQTVTLANTGATAFSLAIALSGDFTQITNCPATLPANSSCNVLLTFAPTAPGLRQGLLAVTAGAGTTPAYVTLTGTATAILPASNGTFDLGSVPVGEPIVQWFKVSQPFQTLTAATTGDFTVLLVEDIGFGHGSPAPSAFQTSFTGSCLNCYLGLQFTPTAAGPRTGSLSLTSAAASPYLITLTGTGLPQTGLLLTPLTQDFGPVPVHSTSQPLLFTLTNATTSSITITPPTTTGDFAISPAPTGGLPCTGSLAPDATCLVQVTFTPTVTGPRTGTVTLQTTAGPVTAAALTGFANPDPGLALSPTALTFQNVPGPTSTLQTITLTNTSPATLQVGTLSTTTANFTPATTCATLAPAATCTATITYTPTSAPTADTLSIPVTSLSGGSPILTTYSVPLTGAYTTQNAALQLVPAQIDFGSAPTSTVGSTRTFTLNNLTAQPLTPTLSLPRQFALSTPNPCPTLAANSSCTFSVTYLPLTSSNITGSILAQAGPTDTAIAYLQAFGTPANLSTLTITGPLSPGTGILDFGQVLSGQSLSKTLTLTNTPGLTQSQPITLRRLTTEPPFLSTTTCGATLQPLQTCTVTITYSPVNQLATGSPATTALPNSGTLILESDAPSSPDFLDLTGSAAPASVTTPVNTLPIAAYTLSQSALTFPQTGGGDASPPQTVLLTNTGTAPIHLAALITTPDFSATSDCPPALAPAAACTLTLLFTPQTAAVHTSALEISSDSATSLDFITLYATSSSASLLLTPTALNFGSLNVATSATLPVQVTNNGAVPVVFATITTTGDYTAAGDCPTPGASLAPATSCTLQVTFTPTTTGPRPGTLAVATSASTLPLTVSLTGIGIQSSLQVTPSALNFGNIAVAASANQTITLSNNGTAPVSRLAFAIAGDYAITTPCALTTLTPGQTCTLTVTFTPTTIGARPGTLTLTSSDPASPTIIPLTGTGIANGTFTLTVDGGPTSTATVKSGSPALYTLTVTPAGSFAANVVLNCTPITPVPYASCSILPSSIALAGSPQNAALTINTVTSIQVASNSARNPSRTTLLCLLAPALLLLGKRRRTLTRLTGFFLCTLVTLASSGCGGGPNPNLRYVLPGTYQFQVTASSTSGIQIVQSVTVTMIVHD